MQRATKKACASLDTELTPDFIARAIESNPVEILNNEALKLEHLFGSDPLPEFKAYHDPYRLEDLRTIVRSSYGKTWNRVIMAVALRPDIPEEHALHYAVRVENKKLVQNITKLRPEWLDWEYLIRLYRESMATRVEREVLRFGNSGEYSALVEFYHRAAPTKDHFWKGFCAFVNTTPQIKWKSAGFRIDPRTINKYASYMSARSNYDIAAKFILYNQGLRHGRNAQDTFDSVYGHLGLYKNSATFQPAPEALEEMLRWMLGVGDRINCRESSLLRASSDTLFSFINRGLYRNWITEFELSLEKVLWEEYKANKGRGSKTSTAVRVMLNNKYPWFVPLTTRQFRKRNGI